MASQHSIHSVGVDRQSKKQLACTRLPFHMAHQYSIHLDSLLLKYLRTGCPWRYLPCNFPPWQTVYYHFRHWRLKGNWHQIYTALRTAERERVGKNAEPSAAIIYAQSVKTVEESASISGFDAHKHVEGRKRHILVDTLGLPLSIYVAPADVHDTRGARCLLAGLAPLVATSQENLGRWSLPRTGVSRVVPS